MSYLGNDYYTKQKIVDNQRQQREQREQAERARNQNIQQQLKRDEVRRQTSTTSNGLSTPWYNPK